MEELNDIKREMTERARLSRGLATAIGFDFEYVYTDVKNFDIICLTESIRESKDTLQKLTDNLTELEYLLYLVKREESRK